MKTLAFLMIFFVSSPAYSVLKAPWNPLCIEAFGVRLLEEQERVELEKKAQSGDTNAQKELEGLKEADIQQKGKPSQKPPLNNSPNFLFKNLFLY